MQQLASGVNYCFQCCSVNRQTACASLLRALSMLLYHKRSRSVVAWYSLWLQTRLTAAWRRILPRGNRGEVTP